MRSPPKCYGLSRRRRNRRMHALNGNVESLDRTATVEGIRYWSVFALMDDLLLDPKSTPWSSLIQNKYGNGKLFRYLSNKDHPTACSGLGRKRQAGGVQAATAAVLVAFLEDGFGDPLQQLSTARTEAVGFLKAQCSAPPPSLPEQSTPASVPAVHPFFNVACPSPRLPDTIITDRIRAEILAHRDSVVAKIMTSEGISSSDADRVGRLTDAVFHTVLHHQTPAAPPAPPGPPSAAPPAVYADPDTPATPRIPSVLHRFKKFGVLVESGVSGEYVRCRPCNMALGSSASWPADKDIVDHICSDKHDAQVGLPEWKHDVHLAPGFRSREVFRDVRQKSQDLSRQHRKDAAKTGSEPPAKRCKADISAEHTKERDRRRAAFSSDPLDPLPPKPAGCGSLPKQTTLDGSRAQGVQSRRRELCKGLLKHWLSAGVPINAVQKLLPWLRERVVDGGLLPTTASALRQDWLPQVMEEHRHCIQQRIQQERQYGVTVMIDETSDTLSDRKPLHVLLVTHAAVYFCDAIFLEDGDTTAAAIAQRIISWWNVWFPDGQSDKPLRLDVEAIATDNPNTMASLCNELRQQFPHAHHSRCTAHILNLVGKSFVEHGDMLMVRQYLMKAKSVLKGKRNIGRRRALRKYMAAHGRPSTVPPDYASTRWSGKYDAVKWHSENFWVFTDWVRSLSGSGSVPLADLWTFLEGHRNSLSLELAFIKEHAAVVYEALTKSQYRTSPTAVSSAPCNPTIHLVFNRLSDLSAKLKAQSEASSLGSATESLLARKRDGGSFVYNVDTRRSSFKSVIKTAHNKLEKYLTGKLELAKAARVFDPIQRPHLPLDIAEYSAVIPPSLAQKVVANGEWELYLSLARQATSESTRDILCWWAALEDDRCKLLSERARHVLAIPPTTCDVERTFTTYKAVRSDKQIRFSQETHVAYVSFGFNGALSARD